MRFPEHISNPGIEVRRSWGRSFFALIFTITHNGETGILQHHGDVTILTLATFEHTSFHVVYNAVRREPTRVASATECHVVGDDTGVTHAARWNIFE